MLTARQPDGVSVSPILRPGAQPVQHDADAHSSALFQRLHATGGERDEALVELRELLLKAARFEVRRRAGTSPHLRGGDEEDLAQQSADDALISVLAKLDEFRGDSRFGRLIYAKSVWLRSRAVSSWAGARVRPLR